MRKLYTILIVLLVTASTFAQAPEKMSYQAVVRDGGNTLLANEEVGIRISILQTTITGASVYTETHSVTTNLNGLVSLEIGTGNTSDIFATTDWSAGPYFIKTEIDQSGGSSYTITGTSQIMSVPFALYANYSGSSETNATNIANNTTAIAANTAKVGYTDALVSANTAVAANTAKDGITSAQSTAITANTAKVGYTDALVSANTAVAANTAKDGITSAQSTAITANTAKVGYTDALVSVNTAVAANTAKDGITSAQSTAITANTAKVGYTDALVSANTAVAANTAKDGITTAQANAITANTAKTVAAEELTGTSLNSTIVGSSLTSVGILTGLTVTGTTETGLVKITGGTPGLGKVLTSDAVGMAIWAAAAVSVTEVDDEFTATTSQTAFTLSQAPSANSKVKMYVNGIRISKTAYTYSSSGTSLTYDPATNGGYQLTAGDRIQVDYFY
jgi:hypothetical protein